MSNIKERIIGAVTVMNDEDAEKVWNLILANFTLTHADETQPEDDELLILKAYHDGDPEYQPHISQEDLIKELDL